ncbi:putative Integrase [Streptomyces azureus]|uniref:Putative Integrase n=1 Tax=Streptomyces azureus TaxID=146537 RepID=A0A0K8PEG5_STRAJ|nr:putative Integrase [Streptomyces azureus]
MVPLPPYLVALWREHVATFGTADDGRLFFSESGRVVAYTTYDRVWHEARDLALPPALTSTPLAKRPYDLRHSALSTWLCASADPAEVAQRAGNSVEVLLSRYAKCLYDRQSINNERIEGLACLHGPWARESRAMAETGPSRVAGPLTQWGRTMPDVPDRPTLGQVQEALRVLTDDSAGVEPLQSAVDVLAEAPVLVPVVDPEDYAQPDRDPWPLVLPVLEQADGAQVVPVFASEERLGAALPNLLS